MSTEVQPGSRRRRCRRRRSHDPARGVHLLVPPADRELDIARRRWRTSPPTSSRTTTRCCNGARAATASSARPRPRPSTGPTRPADSIDLALIRQTATGGSRLGSLLVNPGGPGGSGVDFIENSLDFATDERLQSSYDIVGFDPRGVGRSSAVSCYDDPAELDAYLYDISPNEIGSDAWIADLADANRVLGESCLEHTGELLGFVDTESAARDLDLLRAVLGDEKLNYLGYSYGTLPRRDVRRPLPRAHRAHGARRRRRPVEHELRRHAHAGARLRERAARLPRVVPRHPDCPFRGSVDDAMDDIRACSTPSTPARSPHPTAGSWAAAACSTRSSCRSTTRATGST